LRGKYGGKRARRNMERANRVDQVDRVDVNHGNMVPLVQNNGNAVALVQTGKAK
jgi:hypothetical protein